ncbi:hypothetical protein [Bacillus cereus]|uniref:hypothetical protein n=1 Tax=Bacillus TaxID=1386 RepID=UPI0030131992
MASRWWGLLTNRRSLIQEIGIKISHTLYELKITKFKIEGFTMTGIYQNLGEGIEMMKIQLKDLENKHKYLMKNMEMNAPKFNGVTEYSAERVTGGQVSIDIR